MIDISDFNKDQLAEHAKSVYNVELDLRKSWATLKSEVNKLQQGPAKAEDKEPEVVAPAPATHILNRDTGLIFPYTDALRNHLTNAVPCDEQGNPV